MTPTERLDTLATAIYGEQWALPVSSLSGVSPRTCQRAMAAARDGTDYGAAEGIIRAIDERLDALLEAACPTEGA